MVVIAVAVFKFFKGVRGRGTVVAREIAKRTMRTVEENVEIATVSGNKAIIISKGPKIENAVIYGDTERLNYSPATWNENSILDVSFDEIVYDPYSKTKRYNKIIIITPSGKKFEKELEGKKLIKFLDLIQITGQ